MNEGSMRCDVNLSVRRPGEPFGVRTEMKNLNSFQSVERAIEAEYRRQVEALETREGVVQETRRYDQKTGKTTSMRRKENSADYRYFPDPDLPEIYLSDAEMAEIRASIPALPDERRMRYMQQYGLTAYAAEQLTAERWLAEYFERPPAWRKAPWHCATSFWARSLRRSRCGIPRIPGSAARRRCPSPRSTWRRSAT